MRAACGTLRCDVEPGVVVYPADREMRFLTPTTPGRHLMVLDDAETIARQARRRAAAAQRRREIARGGAVVAVFVVLGALIVGAPMEGVLALFAAMVLMTGFAYQRVQGHRALARRQADRATAGLGIGTPRPKGGFTTMRHRSGAPVWIDRSGAPVWGDRNVA